MIYLDNAATTVMKPRGVAESVAQAVKTLGTPGRGGHEYANRAANVAFSCRELAAKLFDVPEPDSVVFTFNATHALNIAINSLISKGSRVVISGFEHNSVLRPLMAIGADIDIVTAPLFEPEEALEEFDDKIQRHADAVIVSHVSNVFGYIEPLDDIAAICKKHGVPLIIDASQSAGTINISLQKTGAAFIAMPGHKGLYGPQGTGLLLCGGAETNPLIHGGSGSDSASGYMPDFLPDRLEAGTHNMPGIAGLLAGMRYVMKTGTGTILRHERMLTRFMSAKLRETDCVTVYSSDDENIQTGVLSFTIDGIPAQEAGRILGERGIAVRAGLHCSPLSHQTAGTYPAGTVRASVSAFNTRDDCETLVRAVRDIASSKRRSFSTL